MLSLITFFLVISDDNKKSSVNRPSNSDDVLNVVTIVCSKHSRALAKSWREFTSDDFSKSSQMSWLPLEVCDELESRQ